MLIDIEKTLAEARRLHDIYPDPYQMDVIAVIEQLQAENKRLQHFRDTSVGLWATDRPEKLTKEERDRCCLFELKGGD